MNAVIRVNVPDWQIGEEVTLYFKDTMTIKAKCEEDCSTIYCKDCKYSEREEILSGIYCTKNKSFHDDTWFCADAKKG